MLLQFIESLRKSVSTSIWPFESHISKVVCAEIYPSMYKIENTESIKDANQVKAVVKRLHALDVKGELDQIMSIPSKLKGSECTHEGMDFGSSKLDCEWFSNVRQGVKFEIFDLFIQPIAKC